MDCFFFFLFKVFFLLVFLFAMQYRAGTTLHELAEAHAEFERRYAAPLRTTWKPHANSRDGERRLRVGFLSPDLSCHAVGYFLVRCLENLNAEHAMVICYSNSQTFDHLTKRIHAAAKIWHEVYGWTDNSLAEQIRADQVDILFDLAGHTANNRLLVFAQAGPAPGDLGRLCWDHGPDGNRLYPR